MALLLLVACFSAISFSHLGTNVSHSISAQVHTHASAAERTTADSNPVIQGTSAAAFRVVKGALRRASDIVTSADGLVETLPDPGSKAFIDAQRVLVEAVDSRGYAVIDLRLSKQALARYQNDERGIQAWMHQYVEGVSKSKKLTQPFEEHQFVLRDEPRHRFGDYKWHVDGSAFTSLLSLKGPGVLIQPDSMAWSRALVDSVNNESYDIFRALSDQRAKHARRMRQEQNVKGRSSNNVEVTVDNRVQAYLDEIRKSSLSELADADNGSILAEPGELVLFFNRAQDVFAPMLHRRPAERLSTDRKIAVMRHALTADL